MPHAFRNFTNYIGSAEKVWGKLKTWGESVFLGSKIH